jgi:hypothetical protein
MNMLSSLTNGMMIIRAKPAHHGLARLVGGVTGLAKRPLARYVGKMRRRQ